MKYLFQLLLGLCLIQSVVMAENTQLRILVFGDTNDNSIGQSVSMDVQAYKKLASDIKKAVESEGVKTTIEVFSGDRCSYEQLNNYLNDFSCNGDIVFFIYTGHGGRSHKDESKFPRMCLGSNYESKWMKISDLNDRLRSMNPRLMVVVTDCCNSYYDRKGSGNENAYGISTNQSNEEGFKRLFLHYTGEVCITAASPGEFGWGTTQGGMFSLSFINLIYKADNRRNVANWQDLMKRVSNDTYKTSLQYYNDRRISTTQRPVFEVNVIKSEFDNDNNSDDGFINNDSDDEDLYTDYDNEESDNNLRRAIRNLIWVILVGLLFLWIPKILYLTRTPAFVMRIVGVLLFIWAIISFFQSFNAF